MTTGAPELTPDIEATIREGHALGKSQATIADQLGIRQETVSRWAKRLGLAWTYSPQVQAMNTATRERIATMRGQLAEAVLADAVALRERIWDTYQVMHVIDGEVTIDCLDLPDAKAVAAFTQAVDRLIKTHANLAKLGAGRDADHTKSVLAQMQHALEQYATDYEQTHQ